MNVLGIDLGSVQTTAIIAQENESGIKIVGYGTAKTEGVKKGVITTIEPASNSIAKAVNNATMMSGVAYDKVIVSISGSHARSINSNGVVNVPNQEIGIQEIYRAVVAAKKSANVPKDYEIIHVLPYNFKIDDDSMDDPLAMSGIRLEVLTHIIFVKRIHLMNIRKTVKAIDLHVDNIVLSGYASSIACLDKSEKEPGAVLIDMGGAVCDMVAHIGNSLRYNDCLPVASQNITSDLAYMLQTTPQAAEELKLSFASLDPNKIISTPIVGDDTRVRETAYSRVADCIYIRIEETLMILAKMLDDSGYYKSIGSSIVLTGGMTKVSGMLDLASAIFKDHSVRLATAKYFISEGGHKNIFEDPQNSCAIGLCLYGAGYFTAYELDSNSKMRYHGEPEKEVQKEETISLQEIINKNEEAEEVALIEEDYEEMIATQAAKKPGILKQFLDKLTNQF